MYIDAKSQSNSKQNYVIWDCSIFVSFGRIYRVFWAYGGYIAKEWEFDMKFWVIRVIFLRCGRNPTIGGRAGEAQDVQQQCLDPETDSGSRCGATGANCSQLNSCPDCLGCGQEHTIYHR